MLARADERGVDVRGLVWRSHSKLLGFTSEVNRRLGKQLQARGAEALLDMRVRMGGSHHQKLVVIRHPDDPTRDVAYVGGIDLCHSRRDDIDAPRRPTADGGAGRRVRRDPALARHDGRDQRSGRPRRRDRLPRAVAGPDAAHPQRRAVRQGQAAGHGHGPRPAAGAGTAAAPGRGRHARRPAAAHVPQPPPRPRLPVRPRRRAQRGPRLHQGADQGAAADLRRGPVPLGRARRRRLHPGPAGQPGAPRHRRGAASTPTSRAPSAARRTCSVAAARCSR